MKSQDLEFFKEIFAFFSEKKTLYGKIFKILFPKFTWRHRLLALCLNVVKFVRREIGETVRYLPDKKKQKFGSLSDCHYCSDRAQNLPRPDRTIWLTLFQISLNGVHFWWSYSRMREGRSFAP